MKKTKTLSIFFLCLFVVSIVLTTVTKFDDISVPYFKGIRKSVQVDVIYKNKITEVFYDNKLPDVSTKIKDNHYLFGEKKYKKISKIKIKDPSSIKNLQIYEEKQIKKYEKIPQEIEISNEKNIVEKLLITFLSFFYNYKLYLLSYLFLILAVSFSNIKLNHKITFCLITFFSILLRILQINEIPFWDDEVFVLVHTSNSSKLVDLFNDPGNPPLFFILFKIFRSIFQKEEFFRYISVVSGIVFNFAFYIYLKKFLNKQKALFGYFVASISLILIYFSQEIRCYMLLMLFSLLSAIFLFDYKNKKTKILYLINSILLLNTHFYGFFVWAFNFIFGISILKNKKSRLKSFLINNFIAFFVFIPNVIFKQKSINSNFNTWIQVPHLKDFLQVLQDFSSSMIIFGLFLVVLVFVYKKANFKRQKLFLKYNFLIISAVILFSLVFSYLIKPVFLYRYFYVVYPFYLALCVYVVCFEYKTIFRFFLQFSFFILFATTSKLNTQNLYNNSDLYFNFVRQDADIEKRNYFFFNNTVKNYPLYENALKNKGEIKYLAVDTKGFIDINPFEYGAKKPCVCYVLNLYLKDEIYKEANSVDIFKTPLGVILKVSFD